MNEFQSLRLPLSLFCAALVALLLWLDGRWEKSFQSGRLRQNHLPAPFFFLALPFWLLLLVANTAVMYRGEVPFLAFSLCFQIGLQMGLYFLLLSALLPLLRRHFRPQTCALLWLLPNFLYIAPQWSAAGSRPLWVIPVPDLPVKALLAVWLAGFAGTMGWKILSHLRFRRQLLAEARPAEDPELLALWDDIQDREISDKNIRYPLAISHRLQTPLSIGILDIRVLLPQRDYTPEQLTLLLRHELIHIRRKDSSAKLFLTFCTALCWFNPLVWLAMKRSSEDLELRCDQEVLAGAGQDIRRSYAGLLLTTAGEERGFTSCLSASAFSLRYRLAQIVRPAARQTGCLLAGVICFALVLSCGFISLAYQTDSGGALFFPSGRPEDYTVQEVAVTLPGEDTSTRRCIDSDRLISYLAGLEVRRMTGSYTLSHASRQIDLLLYHGDVPRVRVTLADGFLLFRPNRADLSQIHSYLVPDGVDWTYLESLLVLEAPTT